MKLLKCFMNNQIIRAVNTGFAVLFIASMIAGANLYAQDEPRDKKTGPPEIAKEHTPEEMSDHMSAMLEEKLDLSASQKSEVHDIIFNYASAHNHSNFDHKELDTKIEKALTPEQIEKYHEFLNNNRPDKRPPEERYPKYDPQVK